MNKLIKYALLFGASLLTANAIASAASIAAENAKRAQTAARASENVAPRICLWQLPGYGEFYNLDRIATIKVRNENEGNKGPPPRYTTVLNFGHLYAGGYVELQHPPQYYADPLYYVNQITAKLKECQR